MSSLDASCVFWGLVAVAVVGLASACFARMSEGSRHESLGQRLFFACLAFVAATTMAATTLGTGCWLSSGTTFSVMVLMVTCDFSHARRAAAW